MKPTFTDRPADYLMAQRESRDNVRYASAVHQITDRQDAWGRYGMAVLVIVAIFAVFVIVIGKP